MKNKKLIKILASISAVGAIGTGTAISMTSCGNNTPPPIVINAMTISKYTSSDLITFSSTDVGTITGLPYSGSPLASYMRQYGYNALTFDSTITSISERVFEYFSGLSNENPTPITFESPILSIGSGAFTYCVGISKINLAANTTISSLGNGAFDNCWNLTGFGDNADSLTISTIGQSAFSHCRSLTKAGVSNIKQITNYDKIEFDNGVYWLKPGDTTFLASGCLITGAIVVPSSWSTLAAGAFADCQSITQIDLHNLGGAIAESAFAYCSNLTSIISIETTTNSWSWTSIADYAFVGCSKLRAIQFNGWDVDATIGTDDVFMGVPSGGTAKTSFNANIFKQRAEDKGLSGWTFINL